MRKCAEIYNKYGNMDLYSASIQYPTQKCLFEYEVKVKQ